MTDRPTFTVILRAEPDVDAVRSLRWALKTLLRRYGLKALAVKECANPVTSLTAPGRRATGHARACGRPSKALPQALPRTLVGS
jgi:hypothetical protein